VYWTTLRKGGKERTRRKKGGEDKKAMIALLISFYNIAPLALAPFWR